MSGLEVLGAVASAVQLAETCLKITTCAVDLFSRIRDVPETIRKRVVAIEQLVETARLIEHNHSLQTPLIASILSRARADASQLFEILTKIDTGPTAGKIVKYWKALEGVTKEKRIVAKCDKLQEAKASLTLNIASINSDYLRKLNVEFVTVQQNIDGIFKELPAIRDTAGKTTTILNELSATSAKISTLHDEIPLMSGNITTIHNDIPVLANKVTVIHDELPAIREALERLALSQGARVGFSEVQSRQDLFVVPFDRDQDFVGREDIVGSIDRAFSDRRIVRRAALAGLGGIGKTQIAIEYAYRLREKSSDVAVFWVHASNPSRMELSYRAIAAAANLPGADDPKTDVLNMVLRWLENEISRPWFMILDNADDTAVFFPRMLASIPQTASDSPFCVSMSRYLPRVGGSILITSRNGDLAIRLTGKPELVLEVDKLENSDALKLLQNKISADQSPESDWVALIDALDRLPLAITQAAAYIAMRRPRMSVSKYLDYFRSDEIKQVALLSMDGGDLRRDPEVPNAVVKTWQIAFDQVKRQNTLAATVLGRISFFDRQAIPRFLLTRDEDDLEFDEAIGVLTGFSFVRSLEVGDSFDIHPLVQLSTKKWLEVQGEKDERKKEALNLLSESLPTGDYENWSICEILEPHVQQILRYSYESQSCKLERAKIQYNNSWFLLARGNYRSAEMMAHEAFSTRRDILGPEDAATLGSLGLLASTYRNQGRWKEAEELEVQVMEMRKRVLGEAHPSTLTSMANLASTYRNQGRWKEAEELDVQVIETSSRVLGEAHPSTLTSMANLASTYRNQGRWKEAEELEVQVIETSSRVLGEAHPSTLTSMANLASTYRNQGRWKEAEELEVQVMETRKRVLGEAHPSTLTSMANLASTYRNQGRWKEAEELEVQVMETRKRVLGEAHPSTLTSMANLASTYRNQGRWKEAEELDVQVMETRKRVLGEAHPSTLTSMANLASTFWNQGRWKEAEELDVQVMETRKRVLGEAHPSTLTSMANLASTYRNQGRWKEAEELEVQVIETSSRVLGEAHPSTLTSMANLASTYRNQGRWKEAEELEVQVMETRKRVLGEAHPSTLTSMANLASTYRNQGRWKEAEELEVQVMETRKRVLGEAHPSTLTSMANLASTYRNQGRWKEAEELEVQVMETRKRVLGEAHPSTLTSMANLASTYRNQGRWKEAEELEVQVMETSKRVLGEAHPDTLTSMANLAYTWRSQGRGVDAVELMSECYRLRKEKLGASHPYTISSFETLKEWETAISDVDF